MQGSGLHRVIGAAMVLALVSMPAAFAAAGDGAPATSAGVKKQLKKLKKRVAALEAAQAQGSLPPSGPAGGDLTGSYPAPQVAADAVGGAEVIAESLTGADIDEGTLSTVPAATNSANLGGIPSDGFARRAGADPVTLEWADLQTNPQPTSIVLDTTGGDLKLEGFNSDHLVRLCNFTGGPKSAALYDGGTVSIDDEWRFFQLATGHCTDGELIVGMYFSLSVSGAQAWCHELDPAPTQYACLVARRTT